MISSKNQASMNKIQWVLHSQWRLSVLADITSKDHMKSFSKLIIGLTHFKDIQIACILLLFYDKHTFMATDFVFQAR